MVDFIAGTAGGVASLLASHPFDTVKTRLQSQHGKSPVTVAGTSSVTVAGAGERAPLLPASITSASGVNQHHYRGLVDAFRVIVKEEKVLGLYKGVTSPLMGVALMNAAIFGTFSICLNTLQNLRLFSPIEPSLNQSASLTQTFLAGCGSGVLCAFITAPIDLIKIQEQMDFRRLTLSSSNEHNGSLRRWSGNAAVQWKHTVNTVRSIWRTGAEVQAATAPNGVNSRHAGLTSWTGGVRALYRGFGITALRDIGYGPYFLSYELMNGFLAARHDSPLSGDMKGPASSQLSALELAFSGALAGCIGWAATFPLDVVKTRLQAAPLASYGSSGQQANRPLSAGVTPPSLGATFKDIYREGGTRAFFRGLGTTLIRAVPANAALFVTYETVKGALTPG